MTDLATREDWEREFDLLNGENTLTRALADSSRPNTAEPHDDEEHLARAQRAAPSIVAGMLRATQRLAKPSHEA